jgi:hypothetical protein
MDIYKNKKIVGLIEPVTINGNNGSQKKLNARIDTGAERSSIDARLAVELNLGPIIKRKLISSAQGRMIRPIMEATIKFARKKIKTEFSIADRSHMRYKVLVGQNILKKGFLIDPLKKTKTLKKK